MLSEAEGIIPALESAHAVAYLKKLSRKAKKIPWLLSAFQAGG